MCYPMSVSVYGTFILNFSVYGTFILEFSVDYVEVDVLHMDVLRVLSWCLGVLGSWSLGVWVVTLDVDSKDDVFSVLCRFSHDLLTILLG